MECKTTVGPMECGIYEISCGETGRRYIGSSCDTLCRVNRHFQALRDNKHFNSRLQKDFNLYLESFDWRLLEICDEDKLLEREEYWFHLGDNLYNVINPSSKIILTKKQKENFWNKIEIKSDDECWVWTGAKNQTGYGKIGITMFNKRKTFGCHRVAYYITYPDNNKNHIVRHICNNKLCCNPKHLTLGTHKQNAQDKIRLGDNKRQIVTWDIVKSLRQKYCENPNIKASELRQWLKYNYNVEFINTNNIIQICKNTSWRDINYISPNSTDGRITNKDRGPNTKLNWNIVKFIRNKKIKGITYIQLSEIIREKFNIKVAHEHICNIVKNKRWYDKSYIIPNNR